MKKKKEEKDEKEKKEKEEEEEEEEEEEKEEEEEEGRGEIECLNSINVIKNDRNNARLYIYFNRRIYATTHYQTVG